MSRLVLSAKLYSTVSFMESRDGVGVGWNGAYMYHISIVPLSLSLPPPQHTHKRQYNVLATDPNIQLYSLMFELQINNLSIQAKPILHTEIFIYVDVCFYYSAVELCLKMPAHVRAFCSPLNKISLALDVN
jgi:hypothetical protein